MLSDGPKVSATRVCADDIGSALKNIYALRVQASIFQLAEKTTGMVLKPAKCVLIISGCQLTSQLRNAIQEW